MSRLYKEKNRLFKWADRLLGAALFPAYAAARVFRKKPDVHSVPSTIGIIKLCCLGDSLLSTAAVNALAGRFPKARITVIATERTAPVFESLNTVAEVVRLPLRGETGIREAGGFFRILRLLRPLFRTGFDCYLDFDIYYRFSALLGLGFGRFYSAGIAGVPGRTAFYRYRVVRRRAEPEWQVFFRLIAPYGIEPDFPVPIALQIPAAAKQWAAEQIQTTAAGKIRIGLLPGASPNWPEKQWPPAYFARFISLLEQRVNASFFLLGTKGELTWAAEMVKLYKGPNLTVLAGQTGFNRLAAMLAELDLLVSNDSGPMHLSALLGTRTIGLFGPTDERQWSPPGPLIALFAAGCPCRPCFYKSRMRRCDHYSCLTHLYPEQVADKAEALLKEKSDCEN